MRPADLLNRLQDQPFKPFGIHLSDGTYIEVPQAGMVIVGRTTAVLPSQFDFDEEGHRLARQWRTIALDQIVQFTDLEERLNGKRGKRK
ncbi:MAG TPA: hypothetical protein VN541_14400 [Tepidisphaeraceae bacterium]|nr:hypothetical protein [Tepidisphaeraceae bacterium]